MESKIVIYETDKGGDVIEVRLDQEHNTVWMTQKQMSELFDKNIPTINEHLKNIFKEQELDEKATTEDFSVVRKEGLREDSVVRKSRILPPTPKAPGLSSVFLVRRRVLSAIDSLSVFV